jgi:hypothetical protein
VYRQTGAWQLYDVLDLYLIKLESQNQLSASLKEGCSSRALMRDYVLWRSNGKHPSEIESYIAFLLQAKSFVHRHLPLIQFIDFLFSLLIPPSCPTMSNTTSSSSRSAYLIYNASRSC